MSIELILLQYFAHLIKIFENLPIMLEIMPAQA